jgi:hypothetical protein
MPIFVILKSWYGICNAQVDHKERNSLRNLIRFRGWGLKKHEYRCNRCMVIENRMLADGLRPLCSVTCTKCGGLAIRLPVSESIDKLFEEIGQNPADPFNIQHFQPG